MRLAIGAIIVIVILLGVTLLSGGSKSAQTTQLKLEADAVIYDVRTPEEYAAGHAKNAKLLPLSDIQEGALPTEDKNTAIAVYCRSGNRSGQATALLKKAGFTNITDIGAYSNLRKYRIETTS
ncbi:MAG TPA: rhodanese-like domain-containing protein [Candidatus Saccharibacteria bacterium]|nr:rhodanese-like domain-containing protein [Candidatus Saccharibacteria bacterium]